MSRSPFLAALVAAGVAAGQNHHSPEAWTFPRVTHEEAAFGRANSGRTRLQNKRRSLNRARNKRAAESRRRNRRAA